MKKILITALCVAGGMSVFADNAKINPAGLSMLIEQQSTPSRSSETVSVLVRMAEGYTADDLDGYTVLSTYGDELALVEVTLGEVEKLSEEAAVERVSFGELQNTMMDKARKETGVDQIHAGTGISSAFTGKGVLAGIFDTGLDPSHINFSDGNGNSRVKKFYNLNTGRVYNTGDLTLKLTENKDKSHGTHCAGIMGGSYNGEGKIVGTKKIFGKEVPAIVSGDIPYYGVAREADLYLSGGTLSNTNILTACEAIGKYAQEQGQPAVINLSLGSVSGSHDGSSDFDLSLSEIARKYGVIILVASGNDGDSNMSIKKTLTAQNNAIKTFPNTFKQNSVEFWANDNKNITGTFAIYDKAAGKITYSYDVTSDKKQSVTISGRDYSQYEHSAAFDAAFTSNSYVIIESGVRKANNRSYTTFYLNLSSINSNLVPLFIVTGQAGQTLLATTNSGVLTNNGLASYDNGTNTECINEMATSKNVIAVGAYITRVTWPVLNNNNPQVIGYNDYKENNIGEAADFSSYGVTFDGISLPHVCAPGMGIVSSYSTPYLESHSNAMGYNVASASSTVGGQTRMNYWQNEQGTSMATPFTAGTVALWLQADPTLTRDEIINVFNKTSVRDAKVEQGIKAQWGAGKLSAIEGLKYILGESGVGSVFDDEETRLVVTTEGKQINVTVGGANGFDARLYSLSGAMMKAGSTSSAQLDIDAEGLEKGIYVLEINGENAHFTKKITL